MAVAVPAAGAFAGITVALTVICAVIVCIGILTVLHHFFRATFGIVGWALVVGTGIPGIGSWIEGILSGPVNSFERWMNHEFAVAEQKLDSLLGFFLHDMARLIKWTYDEITSHGITLNVIATALGGTITAQALNQALRYVDGYVGSAQRAAEAEAARLFGLASAGIDAVSQAISGQLANVEHAVYGTIAHELDWFRGRNRTLTREYDSLFKRVRRLDKLLGAAAFAAAVAVALRRLGVNWIRCSNWKKVGKSVCGLESSLVSALLAGLIVVSGPVSIEKLAREILDIETELVNGVLGLFSEFEGVKL